MSDNEKTNKSIDVFSGYIRKRLKTHSTLPDENCWKEIEVRLQIRRKRFPAGISATIAASVLIMALLLYNIIVNDKNETYSVFVESKDSPIQNPMPEDIHAVITDKTGEKTYRQTESQASIGLSENRIAGSDSPCICNKQKEDINEQEKSIGGTTEEEPPETGAKDKTKSDSLNKNEYLNEKKISENLLAYDLPADKVKRKKSWQINAGLGTGTGAINSLLSLPGRPPSESNLNLDEGSGSILHPEDETPGNITNINYAIPISAGLTVRKKINKTAGIETGLIYTFLSTDYDSGNPIRRTTLNLHYLGIPANLIINLYDKHTWNLYLSGGGMVEKGLQAVYKRKNYVYYNSRYDKRKSHISGLQWSLNGSIGISYNFYKDMNLYAEPTISYYFDCNQPLSKRTEDPLNFSIRAGIRYDF